MKSIVLSGRLKNAVEVVWHKCRSLHTNTLVTLLRLQLLGLTSPPPRTKSVEPPLLAHRVGWLRLAFGFGTSAHAEDRASLPHDGLLRRLRHHALLTFLGSREALRLPLLLAALLSLSFIFLTGCDYARMYDQDSVKTYERKMPAMDARTMPVNDGFQALLNADPQSLRNPLPPSAKSTEEGRSAYTYFCIQCHGPRLDGKGTVGQSFYPLPANLTSGDILSKNDGTLHARIRLGTGRHPRLFSTVSAEDTWAILNYMRSKRGGQ
jgi:mono/diheme cytochrome c family protein